MRYALMRFNRRLNVKSFSEEDYLAELRTLKNEGDLLPCIVHDLRNRATGIVLVATLLRAEDEDPLSPEDQQSVVDTIENSARDILGIVNAALTYQQERKSA